MLYLEDTIHRASVFTGTTGSSSVRMQKSSNRIKSYFLERGIDFNPETVSDRRFLCLRQDISLVYINCSYWLRVELRAM